MRTCNGNVNVMRMPSHYLKPFREEKRIATFKLKIVLLKWKKKRTPCDFDDDDGGGGGDFDICTFTQHCSLFVHRANH